MLEFLTGCKSCAECSNRDFEMFLADKEVLQMSHISSLCVIVSLKY